MGDYGRGLGRYGIRGGCGEDLEGCGVSGSGYRVDVGLWGALGIYGAVGSWGGAVGRV